MAAHYKDALLVRQFCNLSKGNTWQSGMDDSDPKLPSIDGRRRRSEQTRQAIIEAYLNLVRTNLEPPTSREIATRAGISPRTIFGRFTDLLTLSLAVADYAFEQALARAPVPNLDADFNTRLRAQVEVRAAICEEWLPLWRILLRYQSQSEDVSVRIKRIRAGMMSRLALVYGPELSLVPEPERDRLVIALDILTGFDSWALMREERGLSIEGAREVWINAIGRLLPAAEASHTNDGQAASVHGP
jgi:AcrR family transcriptional regulator